MLSLCDHLFSLPIISVPEAAKRLNVTYSSAQKYIEVLVREGILQEITGRNRNRVYIAKEVMEILS